MTRIAASDLSHCRAAGLEVHASIPLGTAGATSRGAFQEYFGLGIDSIQTRFVSIAAAKEETAKSFGDVREAAASVPPPHQSAHKSRPSSSLSQGLLPPFLTKSAAVLHRARHDRRNHRAPRARRRIFKASNIGSLRETPLYKSGVRRIKERNERYSSGLSSGFPSARSTAMFAKGIKANPPPRQSPTPDIFRFYSHIAPKPPPNRGGERPPTC